MASIPQFYPDFSFPGDSSSQFLNNLNGLDSYDASVAFPDASKLSNCPAGLDDYYGAFNTYAADVSPAPATRLPERFGISDMAAPPEYNNNYNDNNIGTVCGDVNATQYFYNGEECRGFSPEFKPLFSPTTGDQNWGTSQGGKQIPAAEETNPKIGKYSVEERKDRIMRYLKKKNQRNFNKTIKYVCRKTLADRRVRIRGRFARNNEPCEQQSTSTATMAMTNINTTKEEEIYSGDDDPAQIENDDGWLQEAMSNLMYFPYNSYVTGDDHQKTWSL